MPKDGKVVHEDGTTIWYKNGIVHCDDGPAIERTDGTREWYFEGVRHNDLGPAVTSPGGESCWFRRGKQFTEAEFKEMRQREIDQIGEVIHKGLSKPMVASHPLALKKKT